MHVPQWQIIKFAVFVAIILFITSIFYRFLYYSKSTRSVLSAPPVTATIASVSASHFLTPTTSANLVLPGAHCGGFIRNVKQCTKGYHCQLSRIPDRGGICIAD